MAEEDGQPEKTDPKGPATTGALSKALAYCCNTYEQYRERARQIYARRRRTWGNMTPFERHSIRSQWAIAAATIAYTVFAGLQWSVTERNLRYTEENSRALVSQERAWIVANVSGNYRPEDTSVKSIKIVLHNAGRSPATDVRVDAAGEVAMKGLAPEPKYTKGPDYFSSQVVVGPGQQMLANHPVTAITTDWAEKLRAGDAFFYIFGRVVYADIFGTRGETKYCGRWDRTTDSFNACDTYNEVK